MITAANYRVSLTFTEPVLGTVPQNPDIYRDYIESKKPEEQQEDEYKTVEAKEGRGWTGFHREPNEKDENGTVTKLGRIFTYDYTIRGFLKESANALRQIEAHDLRAVKSKIDQFVFAFPRRIFFLAAADDPHKAGPTSAGGCGHMGQSEGDHSMLCYYVHAPHDCLERPLRAETPMGPRVALARSDLLRAGCRLEFSLKIIAPKMFPEAMLRLIFERGELLGFGQFRTGSYGRFAFELTANADNPVVKAVAAEDKPAPKRGRRPIVAGKAKPPEPTPPVGFIAPSIASPSSPT